LSRIPQCAQLGVSCTPDRENHVTPPCPRTISLRTQNSRFRQRRLFGPHTRPCRHRMRQETPPTQKAPAPPGRVGLYDPALEHDACGLALIELGRASCRARRQTELDECEIDK